jgi:tRNA 2-thiouridine synthesizing protein A
VPDNERDGPSDPGPAGAGAAPRPDGLRERAPATQADHGTGGRGGADAAPDDAVAARVDATGLRCPEPLMLVRNRLRDLAAGELLHVRATDPSTERDLRDFCRFLDHELLRSERDGDVLEFLIRKGGHRRP